MMDSTTTLAAATSSLANTTSSSSTAITVITTTTAAKKGMDNVFIVAMACFGAGALLVILAVICLILWCKRTSDTRHRRRQRQRSLEHIKYLEDYSIKTGGKPDEYTPKTTPKIKPKHNKYIVNGKTKTMSNSNNNKHKNGVSNNGSAKHNVNINSDNNHVLEKESESNPNVQNDNTKDSNTEVHKVDINQNTKEPETDSLGDVRF